jgi:hypothetical protein
MLCKEVQNYISTAKGLPFFYVVGDDDYASALDELRQNGMAMVRMSDLCPKDDKFPSVDDLIDYFYTSDVDYRDNKFVVVGLGEYLALRGATFANKALNRLKDTTLGNARAILLLRGIPTQAVKVINDDNRIVAKQRAYISGKLQSNLCVTNFAEDYGIVEKKGIKHLLRSLEDGVAGDIYACTALSLDDSIAKVVTISDAYSAVNLIIGGHSFSKDMGTPEQWKHLLCDIIRCGKDLFNVFEKYDIDDRLYDDLYCTVSGLEYINWLSFLYLKLHMNDLKNSYFKLVLNETTHYDELKINLLVKITKYEHTDDQFWLLYEERKMLLKSFPEADVAIFVKANEVDLEESFYRYTDNTLLEKKMIVKWISHFGINEYLARVYPALYDYLKPYIFDSSVLAAELTEYFNQYKRQKVSNCISKEFYLLVEKYAQELTYTKLPTRDNAIKGVEEKNKAYLYWIDAMGVEYLSYITALAKRKGLSMHIDIVRSELPTITSINKSFYEQWNGGKKYKEEQLDNIKHKDKGGYFFTDDEDPIHIPEELEVIERAVNTAAMELGMHHCNSFVIASDHGASRLAVISKQAVPYDTDTKGEHSGRCCKKFEGCDVELKVEDNGYIMLSDYGRFRGSRQANVEVHGGASLEEIVVPVITFTLKKQMGSQIKVVKPDEIIADRHNGTILTLYISDAESVNNVSVIVENRQYHGETYDGFHYTFELKDIKRAKIKPYTAEVRDGSDLIGNVSFKIKGKAATVKDDFDFGDDF